MATNKLVSLNLNTDIHDRVKERAKAQNRSTHDLMHEAIAQYVDREERREALRQDALRAWEGYQRSGIHATQGEADGWMAEHEAGREPASVFHARLSATCGTDIDLEAVIRGNRSNPGEP